MNRLILLSGQMSFIQLGIRLIRRSITRGAFHGCFTAITGQSIRHSMFFLKINRLIQVILVTLLMPVLVSSAVYAASINELFDEGSLKWQGKAVALGPLKKFYKPRRNKGIWTDDKGLNDNGKALLGLLSKAREDGLITTNYIRKFPKNLGPGELGQAELYLSQAFWTFSRDLYAGRTASSIKESDIIIERKRIDINGWLAMAGRRGPEFVADFLRPPHEQYAALRKQLAKTKSKSMARKIMVNMERWRWLPRNLGRRHVLVNLPAYEIYIRESEKIVDRRKVVIGKAHHKTPMFSYTIKYAEFNPTWTVPRSITTEEFLPKLRRNRRYLNKGGYKVYASWEEDAEEVELKSINWNKVSAKNFPYKIVQQPGKGNALGKVKFMFPNRFKVYLHDTPSKRLFSRSARAYSHGCIRVERPLEFGTKLFGSGRLSKSKIAKLLASETTTKVKLGRTIPIHLAYFSVWVENNGKLKSYRDVYSRDRLVGKYMF